jgi:hypothetical protein
MKNPLKIQNPQRFSSYSLIFAVALGVMAGQVASAEVLQLECTLPNQSRSSLTLDLPVDSNTIDFNSKTALTGVLNNLELRTANGRQLPILMTLKGEAMMTTKGPAFELIEAQASSGSPIRLNIVGPATDLPSELIIDSETLPIVCR